MNIVTSHVVPTVIILCHFFLVSIATSSPTLRPTALPTVRPSNPSALPTIKPTKFMPTESPTPYPVADPTPKPTRMPTPRPTFKPTSFIPSSQPTTTPTEQPSTLPTTQPATAPSSKPSSQPNRHPTSQPTEVPSSKPSVQPSTQPTNRPTTLPPDEIDIVFLQSWEITATSSSPGAISSFTIASWVVFTGILLLLMYRQTMLIIKSYEAKRRRIEEEEKRAQLDEEKAGGKIDDDKFEFWRQQIKREREMRALGIREQEISARDPFFPHSTSMPKKEASATAVQFIPNSTHEIPDRYRRPEITNLSNGIHINRYKPAALYLKRSGVVSSYPPRSAGQFIQPRTIKNSKVRWEKNARSFTAAAAMRRDLLESATANARRAKPTLGYELYLSNEEFLGPNPLLLMGKRMTKKMDDRGNINKYSDDDHSNSSQTSITNSI